MIRWSHLVFAFLLFCFNFLLFCSFASTFDFLLFYFRKIAFLLQKLLFCFCFRKNAFLLQLKEIIPFLNEMIIRLYAFCFLIPFSGVLLQFFEMMIKVGMKRKTLLNDVLRKVVVTSNLFLVFFFKCQ